MPKEPLDPFTALDAIRTYAKVALTNEEPTLHGLDLTLREILNVCDQALPRKTRSPTPSPRTKKGEGE